MTADDHSYVEFLKNGQEAVFRRKTGKHLGVASRCSMAKEHFA
jgi:hypothetical protein